jgi:hypothetical protein
MIVLAKKSLFICGAAGAGLLLVLALIPGGLAYDTPRPRISKSWKLNAIKATYVGSQLKEIDKAHAALFISYDLENNTDVDYRLADTAGVFIMSQLKSNGSLSQEEHLRLSYPVFLPARRRVRIAIEDLHLFAWPAERDPKLEDKLKDFVKQRLENMDKFVIFDESDRCQVELPRAW